MRTDAREILANKTDKSFRSLRSGLCGFLHVQPWIWAMPMTLAIGCSAPTLPQQDQRGDSPIELTASHQLLVQQIRDLMETKGIQRNEESGLDYYSSYSDLYDWELYFDAILLAYYGGEDFAIQGLRVFLAKQQASGFIPRRIPKHRTDEDAALRDNPLYAEEKKEHCKPFLFQIALIISRTRNSTEWITPEDYTALYAYLTHWFKEWDQDQNDLCEWSSAPHSGSDTQLERIGPWGSRFCEGTDLNCFIYRDCQAASYLARRSATRKMLKCSRIGHNARHTLSGAPCGTTKKACSMIETPATEKRSRSNPPRHSCPWQSASRHPCKPRHSSSDT